MSLKQLMISCINNCLRTEEDVKNNHLIAISMLSQFSQ